MHGSSNLEEKGHNPRGRQSVTARDAAANTDVTDVTDPNSNNSNSRGYGSFSSDGGRASATAASSLRSSWSQDAFRKWASLSIDRSRSSGNTNVSNNNNNNTNNNNSRSMRTAEEASASVSMTTSNRKSRNQSSAGTTFSAEKDPTNNTTNNATNTNTNSNDNDASPSSPSSLYYFMSDTSMSEDDDEDAASAANSSRADMYKKFIYRQKLKAAATAAAGNNMNGNTNNMNMNNNMNHNINGNNHHDNNNNHNNNNNNNNNHNLNNPTTIYNDAQSTRSAGDTSLSSAGLSPMTRKFRIQFDNGSTTSTSTSNNRENGGSLGSVSGNLNHRVDNNNNLSPLPTNQGNNTQSNHPNQGNSNSNSNNNSGNDLLLEMRKKFKAAVESCASSAGHSRLIMQKTTSSNRQQQLLLGEDDGGGGATTTNNYNNNNASPGGPSSNRDHHLLEAALMPPSLSVTSPQETCTSSSDNGGDYHHHRHLYSNQQQQHHQQQQHYYFNNNDQNNNTSITTTMPMKSTPYSYENGIIIPPNIPKLPFLGHHDTDDNNYDNDNNNNNNNPNHTPDNHHQHQQHPSPRKCGSLSSSDSDYSTVRGTDIIPCELSGGEASSSVMAVGKNLEHEPLLLVADAANTATASVVNTSATTNDNTDNIMSAHHYAPHPIIMPSKSNDSSDTHSKQSTFQGEHESSEPTTTTTTTTTTQTAITRGRRKRTRFTKNNNHHHPNPSAGHRRIQSGDAAAATLMNPGRQDWIGMNLDNLPLPFERVGINDDDDDEQYNMNIDVVPPALMKSNSNDEQSPLFAYGSISNTTQQQESPSMAWEGFSIGSADTSTTGTPHNNIRSQQRLPRFSQQSEDAFMFSDSSIPISPPPRENNYGEQTQHSSNVSADFNKVWDGDNTVRYVSTHAGEWVPERIAPFQGYSAARPGLRNTLQNSNIRNILRGSGGIHNTRIPEPENESEETESSGGSSSSSAISTSSAQSSSTSASQRSSFELESQGPTLKKRRDTRFDKVMKRMTSVLEKPLYHETTKTAPPKKMKDEKFKYDIEYPTFFCPNCKTDQRAFINVATAGGQFESPLGYLAFFFALYLGSSLFVFGLEEGWPPLDCVYFSVITLTTAGLGDFVPTTDGAKIACSCFIYFGVATIGLLLGSLLASSLDNASKQDALNAQVRDCPNCQRLAKLRLRNSIPKAPQNPPMDSGMMNGHFHAPAPTTFQDVGYEELGEAHDHSYTSSDASSSVETMYDDYKGTGSNIGLDLNELNTETPSCFDGENQNAPTPDIMSNSFETLRRQFHTRHMSFSGSGGMNSGMNAGASLRRSAIEFQTPNFSIDERTPFFNANPRTRSTTFNCKDDNTPHFAETKNFDDSSSRASSAESSVFEPTKPMSRLKAVKYVILTLNQALANSVFIIAIGSCGFYFIEDMTAVNSFYFTTVLLTSVGYGDIVPVTSGGKLFASIYVILAGTILLHNMSLISMIPLELRKRRIEHAVLGQFGNQLTDEELRELSTGSLINRLKLATNRPDGLDECTREMFSLAMLVRLGKITENDVLATFAAFRRLDVGNYGTLNSRTIIEGELLRRRAMSYKNLAAAAAMGAPITPWEQQQPQRKYSGESYAAFSNASNYPPQQYAVPGSPNPFFNPLGYSGGSLARRPSMESIYSSHSLVRRPSMESNYSRAIPISSSFDFDAYESWASEWQHYDSTRVSRESY